MATASAPRQNLQPPTVIPSRKKSVRLTLWPLVAATFFMVSGGTYGTEDIVHGAGYGKAILILLLTPILWSLPTAFMIGELSSALPFEGGYYAWVRRAMGNFWGFQEAWLSLVASIFDMAIYPTLFVLYLNRLFPWFAEGHRGVMVALAVVIVCALLNIAGVRVVSTTSLWLFFALSAPFILIANHSSHLDTISLLSLFPLGRLRRIRPVAAADYFERNKFVSIFTKTLFNILPIARKNITTENNPLRRMREALQAGDSLIIFPEGTRGSGDQVGEFRSGVAHLIEKLPDVPVVPAYLVNMGRSLPKGEFIPVPFFCEIRIGAPRVFSGSRQEITKALEAAVRELSA